MARFKTILLNQGAAALTLAMYRGEKIFPDFAQMGRGRFSGPQATVTELVDPVAVDVRIMDREFIEATGDEPSKLQISVQTLNTGLTVLTPIREILLFANSNGGKNMSSAIPFAYAWLDGDDTDNILPPPLTPDMHDTIHFHELAIFVTNQEVAHIEVSFSFNGFVTHRYLHEVLDDIEGMTTGDVAAYLKGPGMRHIEDNLVLPFNQVRDPISGQRLDQTLGGLIELSDTETPKPFTRLHFRIINDAVA